MKKTLLSLAALLLLYGLGSTMAQVTQSGGSPSTVAATQSGTWNARTQDGSGNAISSTSSALDINIKSGSIGNTAFGVSSGTAIMGIVRTIPESCTQTTYAGFTAVQIATGAGSS